MGNSYPPGGYYVPGWENPETGSGAGVDAPITFRTDEDELQLLTTRMGQGIPLAYGRHLVAGTPVVQDTDVDGNTTLLIALGEGEWDGVELLWVNGAEITLPNLAQVHFHPGLDGEAVMETDPSVRNQKFCSFFPVASTFTTFSRTAYTALYLALDPEAPGPRFDVRGIYRTRRVRIFDAYGNQTAYEYSANPVWQDLDAFITLHLKPRALLNAALTETEKARINFGVYKDSADYADADIGGGIKRFESHVSFQDNSNLKEVFATFEALCRGYHLEQDGKLGLYLDRPRASVFTFDADKIVDASFELPAKGVRDVPNRLIISIRDLESGGADHTKDFAPVPITVEDEDHQDFIGRVIEKTGDYGANTKERTERLARYWLDRSLLKQRGRLRGTIDAGMLLPGDIVTAPTSHGFTATRDWEILETTDLPDGQRDLSLQEYDPTIFSDDAGAQQEVEETNIDRRGRWNMDGLGDGSTRRANQFPFTRYGAMYEQVGGVVNPSQAIDGILTTYAELVGDAAALDMLRILSFSAPPLHAINVATLQVYSKYVVTGSAGFAPYGRVRYSKDGGQTWTDLRYDDEDWDASSTPDEADISGTPLAQLLVEAWVGTGTGDRVGTLALYEAPLEITS
jgi:hypothetical protein